MIGYVSSAGLDADASNAEITVIYADDFGYDSEYAPKEVYTYNRISRTFIETRVLSDEKNRVSYGQLLSIIDLLELEEVKNDMAMKVYWKNNFSYGPQTLRSEYLEGVWFPAPVLTRGCTKPCLNITGILYDHTPSTLEVSFLCDILNMLFCKCKIKISAPFFCLYNSIFVSSDALKLFHEVFCGEKIDFDAPMEYVKTAGRLISNERKTKVSIKKIKEILKAEIFEEKQYSGTRHNFAINIKRLCTKEIVDLIVKCLSGEITLNSFKKEAVNTVLAYVNRFVTLSELFVVSDNLERASDICCLTLYELMCAFAFSEKALLLKSTVRKGKGRITQINKTKIPLVIYPDGRCI